MKKIVSALTVMALVLSASMAGARNLPEKEIKSAAAYYLSTFGHRYVDASDLELVYQIDNPDLGIPASCIFNVAGGGWIMMACNTATDPVIAFNDHCSLEVKAMPANMKWWIENYTEMVIAVQNADAVESFADVDEWTELLDQTLTTPKVDGDPEHVLMYEEWDQGKGDDYNLFTPVVNGEHCPVGCVATALSQIMHYYRFPVQPLFSTSYSWNGQVLGIDFDTVQFDYSLMPNRIVSSSTMAQRREVSKLGSAVGIALHMSYGTDGSGAYTHNVPSNMVTYFKYKRGNLISRESNSDTNFVNQIRDELSHQRPVYMSGSSSVGSDEHAAGHAWVCCGYRDDRPAMYFMNWGWSTYLTSANTWYNLKTNNMPIGTRYNFNRNQRAIIGMYPPEDSTHINVVGITEVDGSASVYAAYPNPATLTVTLPYSLKAAADMNIYSIDGKLVERRSLAAGEGAVELNVSNMPAGIYIYRLGGATGKFMVQ